MKVYSPSDISDLLNIKVGTLRKYSIMFEEVNYTFQKNSRNQRFYTDQDIITLRKFMTLKNNGMTLKEAVDGTMLWHRGNADPNETDNAIEHYDDSTDELKNMIHKQGEMLQNQTELIKGLTERLDEQQAYFDKRLNERDQLLLEEANKQQPDKKGFFAKWFNK